MNGKKQMTIAGIAAAVVLGGSVLTAVNDWSPFTWRWDSDAVHAEIERTQEGFQRKYVQLAEEVKLNAVTVKEIQLNQKISERIKLSSEVRKCDAEPRTDCSKIRDELAWAEVQEDRLKGEFERMLGDER